MNRYANLQTKPTKRIKATYGRQVLLLGGLLVYSIFAIPGVWAYEAKIHQQLTFIAARQFNNCAHDDEALPRFSALDTRYIVRANVEQADSGVFTRMFRWNYYNREDQRGRSFWGIIDTRFHNHFDSLIESSQSEVQRERRLKSLGRILNYVQDVTSPARVVPVYTGRWWRFSVSDRFDRYRLDADDVERAVVGLCAMLTNPEVQFEDLLKQVASSTLDAVRTPIEGFPATWEAYWRFADDEGEFGDYGPAGNNFGDRTQFRCGQQRCLLLKNDPLYRSFATQQHIAAVIATMQAMALLQRHEVERLLTPAAAPESSISVPPSGPPSSPASSSESIVATD